MLILFPLHIGSILCRMFLHPHLVWSLLHWSLDTLSCSVGYLSLPASFGLPFFLASKYLKVSHFTSQLLFWFGHQQQPFFFLFSFLFCIDEINVGMVLTLDFPSVRRVGHQLLRTKCSSASVCIVPFVAEGWESHSEGKKLLKSVGMKHQVLGLSENAMWTTLCAQLVRTFWCSETYILVLIIM